MTVWIVYKTFDDMDVVNDDLEIQNLECSEIIAAYRMQDRAQRAARLFQEDADRNPDEDGQVTFRVASLPVS